MGVGETRAICQCQWKIHHQDKRLGQSVLRVSFPGVWCLFVSPFMEPNLILTHHACSWSHLESILAVLRDEWESGSCPSFMTSLGADSLKPQQDPRLER